MHIQTYNFALRYKLDDERGIVDFRLSHGQDATIIKVMPFINSEYCNDNEIDAKEKVSVGIAK